MPRARLRRQPPIPLPLSWQGWTLLAIFLGAAMLIPIAMRTSPLPASARSAFSMLGLAAISSGFLYLVSVGGRVWLSPAWRWDDEEEENDDDAACWFDDDER